MDELEIATIFAAVAHQPTRDDDDDDDNNNGTSDQTHTHARTRGKSFLLRVCKMVRLYSQLNAFA